LTRRPHGAAQKCLSGESFISAPSVFTRSRWLSGDSFPATDATLSGGRASTDFVLPGRSPALTRGILMATAIFHLNVSSSARDFAAVALEPGVPLVDRSGAHFSLLARWFGPDVAEPVWRSLDQIEFFVRDQQQARLAEVLTRLATPQELSTAGKRFVEALTSRCQKIKTTTETEQHLLASI